MEKIGRNVCNSHFIYHEYIINVHKLSSGNQLCSILPRNEIQDQVLFKKSICLCQHCKVFSNACAKVEKKSVLMTFRDRGNPRPHLTFSIKLNAKTNKSLLEKSPNH